ncbi:DMT family transporter [Microvirga massiliensis]|uniref:DMT family transporter n=1 Tax=Microvirga massiliensis TaxID=1033741 RepID=UPI00062B6CC7|nr:DMT family transporter [Microvirga massiliensis]
MKPLDPGQIGSRLDERALALYAATVFLWGTSWIALRAQLGVVAPEVSILWRFLLAAVGMWIWVTAAREPVTFPWREHVRFFGTGLCLFSFNFILFYYGGLTIPSGLLAVVFSLASVFNLALGALLLGQRVEPAVAAGGLLGACGVALLFWPELSTGLDGGGVWGLILCVLGTIVFCLGNIVSTVTQRRGIPLLSAIAWSMSYGVVVLTLLSLLRGHAFIIEPTARYVVSLVWLAIGASIAGFACYLTLLRRIGAARAGYATVLFPLVALAVSTIFEGYRWTGLAAGGVVLVLAGNLLVLRSGRR